MFIAEPKGWNAKPGDQGKTVFPEKHIQFAEGRDLDYALSGTTIHGPT